MAEDPVIPEIEATPGAPGADSYLSLADAEDLASRVSLGAWAGKSDAEKSAALRRATIDIDSHRFHSPEPMNAGQALAFPRSKDNGSIPGAVKWSAIFQADFILAGAGYDGGKWEGATAGANKRAGMGSPLCPAAFRTLSRFISQAGGYGPVEMPEPDGEEA